MRSVCLAGVLAASTGLMSVHANAAPLVPTIEFEAGPVATVPITSGSVSIGGLTVTGAPLIGSANQPVLRLGGSVSGSFFNPLSVQATEFNLFGPSALANFATSISGILPPLSTVSWSAYIDAANTPFGTGQLIASGNYSDPSSLISVGFFDPRTAVGLLDGPFSISEFVTVTVPTGETVTFNSSVTAAPEPGSVALLGSGLLGLGVFMHGKRRPSTRVPVTV